MRKFSRLKIKKNPATWLAEILILTVLAISMPVYAEETVTENLSGNNNDVQNEPEYSSSIKITYSVETEPETKAIPVEQPDGSTKTYTEESETETTEEARTRSGGGGGSWKIGEGVDEVNNPQKIASETSREKFTSQNETETEIESSEEGNVGDYSKRVDGVNRLDELERRFAETWDNSRMFLWLFTGCTALVVLIISCIKIKRKEFEK